MIISNVVLVGALPQTPLKGWRPLKSPLFIELIQKT